MNQRSSPVARRPSETQNPRPRARADSGWPLGWQADCRSSFAIGLLPTMTERRAICACALAVAGTAWGRSGGAFGDGAWLAAQRAVRPGEVPPDDTAHHAAEEAGAGWAAGGGGRPAADGCGGIGGRWQERAFVELGSD